MLEFVFVGSVLVFLTRESWCPNPSLHCQLRAIEEAEKRETELREREELEFRAQKVRKGLAHNGRIAIWIV